ncbi:MAG: hypothetical protein A2070_13070 [Bdellovibrionales bacterium GWC1_52_8]|nr:MAG: hypothetical protein A2Z97_02610 [Bdellovibrionales bacterium GWB1_52_6]OFZ03487.1 MAG: hypothetical protein A2X97_05945 [Bdellovibrionales bacterium GWA1_52_35]OFZ37468.1 MAG: hypothetical protein A2070_13070 [Bdellovibrionales bacterium GWC1_52_8]HCM41071.1 hypothetical protein [Bdellovibrionales bacterium]
MDGFALRVSGVGARLRKKRELFGKTAVFVIIFVDKEDFFLARANNLIEKYRNTSTPKKKKALRQICKRRL